MFRVICFFMMIATIANAAYFPVVPIAGGGTGAITKAAGFNALSPMTTGGDIIYGGASGTGTRLANGTAGQFLKSNGTTVAPSWATVSGTGGEWVGSIAWATTTNCVWARTSNATFGNQTQDADCDDNSPVASGLVSLVNTGKDLAVEFTITDTTHVYQFFWHGDFNSGTVNAECVARFSDGTDSSAAELMGNFVTPFGSGSGSIDFTSTGVKDVYIQTTGSQANTDCSFAANVGLRTMKIDVYRFPEASSL